MPTIIHVSMNPQARSRFPAVLFLLNAILCIAMAGWNLTSGIGLSQTGLLPGTLPWLGFGFYGMLAWIAFRNPDSPILSPASVCFVFAHSCLVAESQLGGRMCVICLTVAGMALLAASLLAWRRPTIRWGMVAGVVLGGAAGLVHPLDRLDDAAMRVLWPAKILDRAPEFVDRRELTVCSHEAQVRILIYEDARLCGACSSMSRRIVPRLQREFGSRICIHSHSLREIPPGQALPLTVLLSRSMALRIIEGMPGYDEMQGVVAEMVRETMAPAR